MHLLDKWVRIPLLVLLGLVGAGVAGFVYSSRLSPQARAGNRNLVHARQLAVGMSRQEALMIMGIPKEKWASPDSGRHCYSYTPSPLASDNISFCVGADDRVTSVNLGT
ncbi:hypothetical protein [Hymenobacter nitidus]|uniref:hypothetical protein n=1 Tax=Hymenobacter nitidus TaxID=2880929 RepID=UPI001CF37334|nr:hypothetical protein [Hymenobacter nitidus]